MLHNRAGHLHRGLSRIRRLKDVDFVFLQVAIVRHGLGLQNSEHGDQCSIDGAGLAPNQFEHIGIALLRHHAGGSAVGIVNPNKAEFRRRKQNPVLRQPRQMSGNQRTAEEKLRAEIPIRNRIQTVIGDVRKAELAGCHHSIKGEG